MKFYRRFFFFAALLPVIIFSFASCSKKSVARGEKTELVLALRAGSYASAVKHSLPEFEKANNVKCTVHELGQEELLQGTEDYCDIFMVDSQWVAAFMTRNKLAELSSMGYTLDDDIIPATKSICYHKGGLYLVPYYGNVTVLLYNKLIAKEAGFTPLGINSLDDMLEICKFANDRHLIGFIYRGDTNFNVVTDFLPVLLAYGGWLIDQNKKPTVATAVFKKALIRYKELIDTGRSAKKADLIAAIENKAAAMTIGWPGWYTPKKNSSMEYTALTGKVSSDSEARRSNIYGTWMLGISVRSKHKELAVRLLAHLMDPAVQKQSIPAGGVPCRYSSLRDEAILQKFPEYEMVCDGLENGVYRPVIVEWTEFCDILGPEMKAFLDGKKTVETALSDAQEKLDELFLSRK